MNRCFARLSALSLLSGAILGALVSASSASDPMAVVRDFCQADGRGDRLRPRTWANVAPLVTWRWEPAWDRLRLVRGYRVNTPRVYEDGVRVEVVYTVAADILPGEVRAGERNESRTYVLVEDKEAGRWRISAPAPVPHLFASRADPEALAELLDAGAPGYLSASALVWRLLRDAGWDLPYSDTRGLASAPGFVSARTAEVGDVVLYYDGDEPYHVGLLESPDRVVSATLNAGVRSTPFGEFAGEIRYRRPKSLSENPGPRDSRPVAPDGAKADGRGLGIGSMPLRGEAGAATTTAD